MIWIPETLTQSTGRIEGGVHLFFKDNGSGLQCHTGRDENKGIDLKTNGGIVVLSPSVHESGKHYEWSNVNPIEDGLDDHLEMPADIIENQSPWSRLKTVQEMTHYRKRRLRPLVG